MRAPSNLLSYILTRSLKRTNSSRIPKPTILEGPLSIHLLPDALTTTSTRTKNYGKILRKLFINESMYQKGCMIRTLQKYLKLTIL